MKKTFNPTLLLTVEDIDPDIGGDSSDISTGDDTQDTINPEDEPNGE